MIANRGAITACVILAVIMQALDTTIANVALPYIQGSVSASADQINWVLTSYIVAAAIMTPPSGFLAARFGRKNVLLTAIVGFVVASVLCGLAQSLPQIVVFRLMQGLFGASLVPLSQGILLDIYSVEERGKAMALFGVSVMVGPVLGPVIGGWLTDNISWRWVFYINVPIGMLAFFGIVAFVSETTRQVSAKLDWFGFGTLEPCHRNAAAFPRPWRTARLVLLHRDPDRSVDLRQRVLSLPRSYVHGEEFVRQSAAVPRPQLLRQHVLHLRHRRDLSGVACPDDALFADAHGLSRHHGRHRHGTARHRNDGLHVHCRPADRQGRHPSCC